MKKRCKECCSTYIFYQSCSWKENTFAKAHGFCSNRCMQTYCEKEDMILQELKDCKEYFKGEK